MECPVCLDDYSAEAHQPKILPCGHTACLPCLRQVPRCPECRQPFEGAVQGLPTNFALLQAGGRVAEEWWCSECGAPAEEGCRREHLVMQAQAALRRQALQLAPAAAEAAQGLGEAVRAAAAEPARAALQLLAEHQADAAADCRLSLRRGDAAFNAQCTLADAGAVGALARVLVCALAAQGRLLRDEPQQEQPVIQEDEQQQPPQQQPPQQQPLQQQPPQEQQPPQQEPQQAHAEGLPAVGQPVPVADVIDVVDLQDLSWSGPLERQAEKEQLLQRVRRNGVRKLICLNCSIDPEWALALLRAAVAAGRMETLYLVKFRAEHLRAANEAHGLRVFNALSTYNVLLAEQLPELPALPQPSTLRLLGVYGVLPDRTLASLLRANRYSLSHLVYSCVDTPDAPANALGNLLAACGLVRLRMVLLGRGRPGNRGHSPVRCRLQIDGVLRALPAVQAVMCDACDDNAGRRFEEDLRLNVVPEFGR